MKPLFAKIVGKAFPASGITGIILSSSGSDGDNFSIEIERIDGENGAEIKSSSEDGMTGEKLSNAQWRILLGRISGHAYIKKQRKRFWNSEKSSAEYSCIITGDGTDPEREVMLSVHEFDDLKETVDRFTKYKNGLDAHNIAGVNISFSGDMAGSSWSVALERRGADWFVVSRKKDYFRAKEKYSEKPVDSSFRDKLIDLIGGYDLAAMKELHESEIQEPDGGSTDMTFMFEPYERLRVSSTMDLSEEALDMWDKTEKLLRGVWPD